MQEYPNVTLQWIKLDCECQDGCKKSVSRNECQNVLGLQFRSVWRVLSSKLHEQLHKAHLILESSVVQCSAFEVVDCIHPVDFAFISDLEHKKTDHGALHCL